MKLTTRLRKQGYDLIQGPVRNQGPLQLWLKRPLDEAELYYTHIDHAFESPIKLGKRVGLSYDQVTSTEVAIGDVQNYLMSANDIGSFPIAVKVHRIDFDGGQFVNTTLLSDRRNLL